jgi:hypothetical protein|tara:strand:- start:54 stop:188 length:135 start_codon:yes stop_codon:yes gene_type:complete
MSPETKEILYRELNNILTLLEDGGINMAKKEVEELIQKIHYNQL